jgi:hypothetical protein
LGAPEVVLVLEVLMMRTAGWRSGDGAAEVGVVA